MIKIELQKIDRWEDFQMLELLYREIDAEEGLLDVVDGDIFIAKFILEQVERQTEATYADRYNRKDIGASKANEMLRKNLFVLKEEYLWRFMFDEAETITRLISSVDEASKRVTRVKFEAEMIRATKNKLSNYDELRVDEITSIIFDLLRLKNSPKKG